MRCWSKELAKGSNIYSAPTVYQSLCTYFVAFYPHRSLQSTDHYLHTGDRMGLQGGEDTCPAGFEP